MKRTLTQEHEKDLGWQGFQIPLPSDWSFAAFSGDWNSGYLRAESPDGSALELKWKHDKTSPSLKGVLKSYMKQLNRAAGRKDEVEVKEKPKALPRVPQGNGVSQTFSWRSQGYGVGAVWHCLECRRIVLVQVTAENESVVDRLARQIIPHIHDHPDGDTCRWSVYDFTFDAPKEFKLEKQSLFSGRLSFEFRNSKRRTLVVERYGPANVLLKRDRLADWSTAVKTNYERLKPFGYKKTVQNDDGIETVVVKGRRKRAKEIAIRVALWFIRRQAVDAIDMRIWQSDLTNRIYMVMAEATPREIEGLATELAASVRALNVAPEDEESESVTPPKTLLSTGTESP